MTIKPEINSCSLTTLHTNMKHHKRTFFDNTVFYQWHGKFRMWCDTNYVDTKVEDFNSINMDGAINV